MVSGLANLQLPLTILTFHGMDVALSEPLTVERFLAWEDKQEGRHEFDGTQVIEMTGGSRAHQRVISNLVRLLEDVLNPDRFDVIPEMRIDVGGKIRYPDVAVVAGHVPDAVRTLHDAVVLFEVLSEETAATDHGEKRAEYANLPGIRGYVLLEQFRGSAILLQRTAEGWVESAITSELHLTEPNIRLPLDLIYRGVGSR
jgi:Uma2 family endonuclease